jgi:hypothetical protein
MNIKKEFRVGVPIREIAKMNFIENDIWGILNNPKVNPEGNHTEKESEKWIERISGNRKLEILGDDP